MPYPFVPLFDPRIRVIDSSMERVALATVDDGPPPVPGGRPKGCKRPHTNATVATVRRLIEQTTLTYKQIAQRTGATHSTVGRWAREGGWQRHPFAPRASDTVPPAPAAGSSCACWGQNCMRWPSAACASCGTAPRSISTG
jgi:hypothetical protein